MDRFEQPTTSFLALCRKPEKEIFEFALRQVGLPAEKTLFIDDKEENVTGARAAGIRSELYTNAENLENFLRLSDLL